MSTRKCLISGVTLTDLREIKDDRGAVLHMLRNDAIDFTRFGECYFSEIVPGAVKAWKRHRKQTQNLAVPTGRVRFVLYDDRRESASYGKIDVVELGRPDNYRRLRILPGVWYGFECISEIAALVANCTDLPHDPSESDMISNDDPRIPFEWNRSIK